MLHGVAVQDARLTFSSALSRKEEDAIGVHPYSRCAHAASLLSIEARVTGTTTRKAGGG